MSGVETGATTAPPGGAEVDVSPSPEELARQRRRTLGSLIARYGVIVAMVLTFIGFGIAKPDSFLNWVTFKAILRDMAPLLIVALGVTVVLVMNEFDLSVGGMLGLLGTSCILLLSTAEAGLPIAIAVVLTLAMGAALGFANGVLIAYAGGSSFIITIATGTFFTGADLQLLGGNTIFQGIPQAFRDLAGGTVLGFSSQVFVALAVLLAIYVLLAHTQTGRYMYAIGGNLEAARLSGVSVKFLKAVGFAVVGVCVAVAAVLVGSQAGSANPNSGSGFLLPAYAGAFLGSVMWKPGVFTPQGTLLGALFLQIIGTGLALFNLSASLVLMIQGAILVAAILVSRLGRT